MWRAAKLSIIAPASRPRVKSLACAAPIQHLIGRGEPPRNDFNVVMPRYNFFKYMAPRPMLKARREAARLMRNNAREKVIFLKLSLLLHRGRAASWHRRRAPEIMMYKCEYCLKIY